LVKMVVFLAFRGFLPINTPFFRYLAEQTFAQKVVIYRYAPFRRIIIPVKLGQIAPNVLRSRRSAYGTVMCRCVL